MSQDKTDVTRVINLYIDGAGNGNADQMNEAFHSSARWFGTVDGADYDLDKEGFVTYMVGAPGKPTLPAPCRNAPNRLNMLQILAFLLAARHASHRCGQTSYR